VDFALVFLVYSAEPH